jgi:phosphoglycerate dehydrogenase-like enzyme
MSAPRVAVAPTSGRYESLIEAVRAGGGRVVEVADAEALVWADAARPDLLPEVLASGPSLEWVQLPFAGIENYVHLLDTDRTWTCGKGVYAPPVAEHALAMTLAGLRHLVGYARAGEWSGPVGRNLLGAQVVILGGGEITVELLAMLEPFGVRSTVVRKHPEPVPGASHTVGVDQLDEVLPGADVVILALALTPETEGILDARTLALLPAHAWVVNVARGRHIVTDDLVAALEAGRLGGAALDVTEPEPLPTGHPLWRMPNVLITPHVGNTPEMGVPLLAERVRENVRRFAAGEPLLGLVDVDLGY